MTSPRRKPALRGAGDAIRAGVVVLIAFAGFQAASSDGALADSADWIGDIDLPGAPHFDLPDFSISDFLPDAPLWTWQGAISGPGRTVVIDIDPSIYPTDGVEWFVNGAHDRFDRLGPLDEALGLWHSRTQTFVVGDIVSACWLSSDGIEHCPTVTIR